jgi:hypothetical protein
MKRGIDIKVNDRKADWFIPITGIITVIRKIFSKKKKEEKK